MGDRVELMKEKKADLKEAYGAMSKEKREEHFGVDPSFKFHHMRTKVEGGTKNLTEEDEADIEHDIALAHTLQKQYLTQQELARQEAHGEDLVIDFDPESDFGLHDSIRETTNRLYGQDTLGDVWDHQKEVAGSKDPLPLGVDGTTHITVVTETPPGIVFETQPGSTTGFSSLNEEGWSQKPEEKQPGSPKPEEKQPESPKPEEKQTESPKPTPQEEAALARDPDVDFNLDDDAYSDVDEGWSNEPQHTGIAHVVESYRPERPPVEDLWYGQAVQEEPDEIHEPEFRALPDQFYAPSVITQLHVQNRLAWGWNLTQYPRRMKRKLRRRKVKRNV